MMCDKNTVETDFERRFKCPDCEKSFKQAYSLKIHSRVHTGEMPFRCRHPGCSEVFMWRSGLVNHARHHDPNQQVQRRNRRGVHRVVVLPKPSPVGSATFEDISRKPRLTKATPADIALQRPSTSIWTRQVPAAGRGSVPKSITTLPDLDKLLFEVEFASDRSLGAATGATAVRSATSAYNVRPAPAPLGNLARHKYEPLLSAISPCLTPEAFETMRF